VQRRLWPLALLLLAALVAVPVLLSKEPPPPELPSPAANAAAEAAEISSSPIVAEASAADREQIRRVVGAKVDPFKPAPAAKVKKAAADKAAGAGVTVAKGAAVTTTTVGPASGGVPSAGGFGGGGSIPSPGVTTPSTPATPPTPAAPRKPTYPLYSLAVRWGATDSTELTASRLERLKALPSNDAPVVIYLGVLEDEETAVFMVDASATPDGDGRCRPAKADCQTLHLREGETAFFDVADAEGNVTAQYQLDLVDIAKGRTANAKKAAQARAAVAKGGKALLRKRLAQASSYDYDQRAGLLEKLPVETVKGKLAKIAGAIGF
jgi:hypothetical protein